MTAPTIEDIIRMSQSARELTAQNDMPLFPKLVVGNEAEQGISVFSYDDGPDSLPLACLVVPQVVGSADWLCLTTDDERREEITVHCVLPQRTVVSTVPYVRLGRTIVWHEPVIKDDTDGLVIQQLLTLFTHLTKDRN